MILRHLESSPDLKGISHIVVDEVHERSLDSDFLLIILKGLLARRPDLKLILSATTQTPASPLRATVNRALFLTVLVFELCSSGCLRR